MTFNIIVKVDKYSSTIKNECIKVLSDYLNSKGGYFAVEYKANEIDIDSISKA